MKLQIAVSRIIGAFPGLAVLSLPHPGQSPCMGQAGLGVSWRAPDTGCAGPCLPWGGCCCCLRAEDVEGEAGLWKVPKPSRVWGETGGSSSLPGCHQHPKGCQAGGWWQRAAWPPPGAWLRARVPPEREENEHPCGAGESEAPCQALLSSCFPGTPLAAAQRLGCRRDRPFGAQCQGSLGSGHHPAWRV